jgi:hypothetical protein
MSVHQIQALLCGALALFLAWQVIRTLVKGEVTISLNGRGVKRADDARNYWAWTLILCALFVVVALACVNALRAG